MSDQDLLALAEKSAENDLAFLIRAKEEAKRRMKESPSKDNIKAFERAKTAVEEEAARLQAPAPTGRTFKTQLEAVDFLKAQGFKVEKSKFNKDVKRGRITPGPGGVFEPGALMAYAAVHLKPMAQATDSAGAKASVQQTTADARLKDVRAAREELRLKKDQGLLMPRADHEQDLASRALFFKAEIEGFIHRLGGELIALVHGEESKLAQLIEWWDDKTADWMDAWSVDREFSDPEDDEADPAPVEEPKP